MNIVNMRDDVCLYPYFICIAYIRACLLIMRATTSSATGVMLKLKAIFGMLELAIIDVKSL